MDKKIYVIYEEYDRGEERHYNYVKVLNDNEKGRLEATVLCDAHPDARVIYGVECAVIREHTTITIPEEKENGFR